MRTEKTSREFKRRKRREFNAALRAMHKLMIGCAFMPGGTETGLFIGSTYDQMKTAKKKLQEWWGKA